MNFFSKTPYIDPPEGWSKRELTYWDSSLFARDESPVVGWVFEGSDLNIQDVSSALGRAVRTRSPWLRGRLARTKSGSPPYEIHVPPESDLVASFDTTISEITDKLNAVLAYTSNNTPSAKVQHFQSYDPKILNPRTSVKGVEEYITKDLPLFHLHFIVASDATLISLSWSHTAMDALAAGEIVKAWELAFSSLSEATTYPDINPPRLFDFTKNVEVEEGWIPEGSIIPTTFQLLKLMVPYFYEIYTNPLLHGSIFIPKALIDLWMRDATAELAEGEQVSKNDLVVSWIFKYAFGGDYFPDSHYASMFTTVNFRGRHPSLPKSAITNTAKAHPIPPFTTLELRNTSLSQIALRLKTSMGVYEDPEYVEKIVAHEYRVMKKGNGKTWEMPLGILDARVFGTISWADMGLGRLNFGSEKPVTVLTYCSGRGCATVVDCEEGNWRVDYKLSARAWKALENRMEKENDRLSKPAVH